MIKVGPRRGSGIAAIRSRLGIRLLLAIGRSASCARPRPLLPCLRRLNLIMLRALLQRMLVEPLVALDVLLFLFGLSHDLSTFLANRGLEVVRFVRRCFLATFQLILFHGFLVVWVVPAFGNRLRWLACLLKDLLAVFACAWHELALFLNLSLYFSLFQVYELLFALEVLRHALTNRLEPLTHLLRLLAHRLRLECAPFGLFL